MLYFICTTGNMVPDTFSCPSKSSRIFIKVFFFCLFPHTTVGVVLRYQNQNQSGYHWYHIGTRPYLVPLSHFSAPRLAHFLVPELLHIILVGSRT